MGRVRPDLIVFMRRHREKLKELPVAMFLTCLRLTVDTDGQDPGFPVYIDAALQEGIKPLKEMSLMEKSHTLMHYCEPVMKQLSGVRPEAFAVFKGALDYGRLDIISGVFMRFMSLLHHSVREGDFVNHTVVSAWVKKFYLDLTR
jgi:menaquinone-dependent protoporphyrinogen IX oxidase